MLAIEKVRQGNVWHKRVAIIRIPKKYDKEMFGTKELQSLEYPNKKD